MVFEYPASCFNDLSYFYPCAYLQSKLDFLHSPFSKEIHKRVLKKLGNPLNYLKP